MYRLAFGQISGPYSMTKQAHKINYRAEIINFMQMAEIRITEHFPHGLSPQPLLSANLMVFLWLDQVEPCENHTVTEQRTPLKTDPPRPTSAISSAKKCCLYCYLDPLSPSCQRSEHFTHSFPRIFTLIASLEVLRLRAVCLFHPLFSSRNLHVIGV